MRYISPLPLFAATARTYDVTRHAAPPGYMITQDKKKYRRQAERHGVMICRA